MVRFKQKNQVRMKMVMLLAVGSLWLPIQVLHAKSDKHAKKVVEASDLLIDFKYDNQPLKEILEDFAQMRDINIVYPEGTNLTAAVTFDAGKKISRQEAWEFLMILLDHANFSLVRKDAHTYFLMTNKNALKEAVPLYMNIDYRMLPETQEKIRYVYTCTNISLMPSKQQGELTNILTSMLATNASDFTEKVYFEDASNSIIFTAPSDLIRSAMQIVAAFDEVGVKESVQVLPLKYASSHEVATILTNMIGADARKTQGFISLMIGPSKAHYFSEHALVLDMSGKGLRAFNSLIIMGRDEDVGRIVDFIKKYIDVPQQQGKSFFHVIDLDWIQSSVCLTALQALQKPAGGAGGQSTAMPADAQLAFDPQMQIISDTLTTTPASTSASSAPTAAGGTALQNAGQHGGNRIIIASSQRDWTRLESVIKQIDVPRKQVIIEAIVVDLDLEFVRRLATQLRTRGLAPNIFPKYMQAQAGMIVPAIINQTTDSTGRTYNDLLGNLSNILAGSSQGGYTLGGFTTPGSALSNNGQVPWSSDFTTLADGNTSATSSPNIFNGSTIFMINGSTLTNGVWAFFQLLQTHKSAKVLTRPVIIASNNQPAILTSAQLKNLAGSVTSANSPTINYSMTPAAINLSFTPTISNNDTVNLTIDIQLNVWQDAASEQNGTKTERSISTTVSMQSGNILVLGGLIKEVATRSKRAVPFFDKIPIIGNLVANRYKNTTRDQLFVLIRPTVIAPRTQGGMGNETKHAANYVMQQLEDFEDVFSNLKDPVTRWFFNEETERGSVQMNDKIKELTFGQPANVETTQLKQVDEFFRPKYDANPLGINWFGDTSDPKVVDKKLERLEKDLKTITNPFSGQKKSKTSAKAKRTVL